MSSEVKRAIGEEEIDLKKKRKERMRKSLFGMSDIGAGIDWASKFAGSEHHVAALEHVRERQKLNRRHAKERAVHEKSYGERVEMSPVLRAKYDQRLAALQQRHEVAHAELNRKRQDLEDKLLDAEIERAKQLKVAVAPPHAGKAQKGILSGVAASVHRKLNPPMPPMPKQYSASKQRKLGERSGFKYSQVAKSGPGSRGGHVIGHTKSGKPIYMAGWMIPEHAKKHAQTAAGLAPSVGSPFVLPTTLDKYVRSTEKLHAAAYDAARKHGRDNEWSREDHADAAQEHVKSRKASAPGTHDHFIAAALSRAHAMLAKSEEADMHKGAMDADIDPGRVSVGNAGGKLAMRVDRNPKCDVCAHYDDGVSACMVGLIPSSCGDGSYPEVGFAPVVPDRIAAQNWKTRHQGVVVTSSQAPEVGDTRGEVPFRIEVLGDSALTLSERMTLVKAAQDPQRLAAWVWHHHLSDAKRKEWKAKEPAAKRKRPHQGKGRPTSAFMAHMTDRLAKKGGLDPDLRRALAEMTGEKVLPPCAVDFRKAALSVEDFADVLGTTPEVVRSIALRLGEREKFLSFVKSKLPDVRIAHGITEDDAGEMWRAIMRTLKSLSDYEWQVWKGVSLREGFTDADLARAIEQQGLLDGNSLYRGELMATRDPVSEMPDAEPLQSTEQVPIVPSGYVGGNLCIADDLARM